MERNTSMLSYNILTPVLEAKTTKNDVVIGHTNHHYYFRNISGGFDPNQPYPRIYSPSYTEDHIADQQVNFTQYDDKGNLLEAYVKGSSLKTRYIWDYHKKYPIAKIAGQGNITPASALVTAAVNASENGDSQHLRDALQAIRDALPHAQVTTYTYENLVGITTITDPRGYTTYYDYDAQNRLEFIKDAYGKILSKTTYNYKN